MKSLKSKVAIDNAKRWAALKKKIAQDSAELETIKNFFKPIVKNGEAVSCGKYVVGSTLCKRSSLDGEAILKTHGQDFIENFSKVTEYVKLDIKVAANE